MKKLLFAASAAVFSLALGFGVMTSTNSVNAQAANLSCEVRSEVAEGIGGTPMYDPHAGVTKKFVKKDGKAYIRVVVTGKNCSQEVSLVSWKAPSISGTPYRQQVILESKTDIVKSGDSKTFNVQIPECFFQIDLVRGGPNGSSQGGGSYGNRMIHSVHGGNKTCFPVTPPTTPPTTPPVTPPTPQVPTYKCESLNISAHTDRSVKVTEFKTQQSNGAVFSHAVINWGDNTSDKVTNAVGTAHKYAADGSYTVTATAYFSVNGAAAVAAPQTVACSKNVTFNPTTPPVVEPPVVTTATPKELPNTGAGAVAAIFAGVTTLAGVAHWFFMNRRLGL